ncbi:hypothetical protein [Nocardia arthritidis]|uniref:Uncharacterized protein n=1 Tax=Nocardia arthritidis TaxID=228602 RepID=A0A6G9YBW4_9NOCA|nr:hypothetical protein [Nocardia arthritidis]QIS10658.1 hypothetical protein F5544_13855 [Nocardia arthritidis]
MQTPGRGHRPHIAGIPGDHSISPAGETESIQPAETAAAPGNPPVYRIHRAVKDPYRGRLQCPRWA